MKKVSFKKYVVGFIILLILLILAFYLLIIQDRHGSPLLQIIPEIKYNEFDDYVLDNGDCIIYIGNNDIDVNFETDFGEYIKENNLDIIYMYTDNESLKKIDNKYNENITIPSIMIFKNREILTSIKIDSKLGINSIKQFFIENEVIK